MTYKYRGTQPSGLNGGGGSAEADNQPDWVIAFANGTGGPGVYAYASNSDRTSWTTADYITSNRNATNIVAVGKNAAGNGIFVVGQKMTSPSNTHELAVSGDDITDGNTWTEVSLVGVANNGNTVQRLLWSADSSSSTAGVWLAGSNSGKVFRSTDGAANWTELTTGAGNLPGTWGSGDVIGMTANGSGRWVMAQGTRLFNSTDNGANFTEISHGISNVSKFLGVIYTNNSYVVVYDRDDDNEVYLRSAADSDLTTWSSEINFNGIQEPGLAGQIENVRLAANSSGRVVFVSPDRTAVGFVDVNGTTTSNNTVVSSAVTAARDISTDGQGNWLVVCEAGDIFESTNDGASWSKIVDNVPSANCNINCIASNYYLPL
tara:strand:- start:9 stop:1136 length:1128 start_codon:yes stop_codon:yes gene_type:complete